VAVQLPCQAEQRLKNAGVAKKMVRRSRKSRAKGWDFFPMGGAAVAKSQLGLIILPSLISD
jgi:hypothetical protein